MIEIRELASALSKLLTMTHASMNMHLLRFKEVHGEQGLEDMAGYLEFAKLRNMPDLRVATTILHDLKNNRATPKTKGYSDFLSEKRFEK